MATKRKYKAKRYNGEFGSDVDAANATDDPIESLNKSRGWTDTGESSATPEKKMSFKEAFASARKAGDKTFEWQGKKYTTEVAAAKPKATSATDTGDETKRLASRTRPTYETPYDRMNRQNREAEAVSKASRDSERAALRENVRSGTSGKVNPKTLLPMKKGGSVSSASSRADGCAQRGKTRGRMM